MPSREGQEPAMDFRLRGIGLFNAKAPVLPLKRQKKNDPFTVPGVVSGEGKGNAHAGMIVMNHPFRVPVEISFRGDDDGSFFRPEKPLQVFPGTQGDPVFFHPTAVKGIENVYPGPVAAFMKDPERGPDVQGACLRRVEVPVAPCPVEGLRRG